MSLPKEPRQKMINIMYLVLTALLALNVSSEILNAFKTVRRSLENTNATVNQSTGTIMKSLEEKTTQDATKERALKWHPIAQKVTGVTETLYNYIENLKAQIISKAGGDITNPSKSFKEDNLDIVTRIMIKEGQGNKLKAMLEQYSKDVRALDPELDSAFKVDFVDVSNAPGRDGKTKAWDISYFHMVPTVAGLTILSKFQNDLRTAENKVVAECHKKVGEVKVVFDAYAAIVGQNSTYLMPGQNIEIKAGVGSFSKAARPVISIGGNAAPLLDSGFARQSMPAGAMGPHTIPVTVRYFNQISGKEEVLNYDVKYVVGSSNTSIGLPEMNVLYVGWPNQISIAASGAGDDRVTATIQCGTITKKGGGIYVANVSGQSDNCLVNVMVDGKVVGSQSFRVRNIPDPVATVGGIMSNENMTAGQFRAQSGVGAFIKDFPLKLQYTVTSFTLTADDADGNIDEAPCQGNTWSPKALNMIKGLTGGRTVTIDNIRATGPDGKNRKIPGLVYYIK